MHFVRHTKNWTLLFYSLSRPIKSKFSFYYSFPYKETSFKNNGMLVWIFVKVCLPEITESLRMHQRILRKPQAFNGKYFLLLYSWIICFWMGVQRQHFCNNNITAFTTVDLRNSINKLPLEATNFYKLRCMKNKNINYFYVVIIF